MKIFVTAKPQSKRPGINKLDDAHFVVAVKEPAKEGKANHAINKVLAKHFDVAASRVELVSGQKSKTKVFRIL